MVSNMSRIFNLVHIVRILAGALGWWLHEWFGGRGRVGRQIRGCTKFLFEGRKRKILLDIKITVYIFFQSITLFFFVASHPGLSLL
jgi:hypothetical protein